MISYFPTALIWLALGLAASLSVNLISKRFTSVKRRYWYIGYRLFVPYLGLLFGGLSPYLMGLTNIDWAVSLGIGVGLFFAILLIILLISTTLLRGAATGQQKQSDKRYNDPPTDDSQTLPPSGVENAPEGRANASSFGSPINRRLVGTALEAVAEQFYWVFIRAAIWEALIQFQPDLELPAYHALWIAAFIAIPDTLLHTNHAHDRLVNICIFMATSILFFFTRNFWLCAALHICMALLLGHREVEPTLTRTVNQPQSLRQIETRTQ